MIFSFNLCNFSEKSLNNENEKHISHNVITEVKKDTRVSFSKPFSKIHISKIGLDRDLYDINSKLNTVNKNIEILNGSDMPDIENGNFILASHSGNSPISYFRNLYKLDIGDEIVIDYNDHKYVYNVNKKYEVVKTGKVSIKRDKDKRTITLITCKGVDKQLVVIGYLI